MYNMDQDILDALDGDRDLNLTLKSNGKVLRGTCPDCGKKSFWVKADKPWYLNCDHQSSCGYSETVRQRYPELWENLSERFPTTEKDPKATARAYIQLKRGFDGPHISSWYEQGVLKLAGGKAADTVRFYPWGKDYMYWERLIDDKDVKAANRKNHWQKHSNSDTYSGKHWMPPEQEIKEGDSVYIVEGIFHAIALWLCKFKVVAVFSSNNTPRELVKKYKGKKIKWFLGYDDDPAGHDQAEAYHKKLLDAGEKVEVVLTGGKRDWDDIYREGKLDSNFMEQCLWRGRIFIAGTAKKRAYAMYGRQPFGKEVFEFRQNLYVARFSQEEFSKANENEAFKWDFCWDAFNRACSIECISNCVPHFTYVQQDKLTEERLYFFTINKAGDKRVYKGAFTPNALTDPRAFNLALMSSTSGATFDGGAGELKTLRQRWLNRKVPEVQTIPYIGYDEKTNAYVFPGFGYHQGKLVEANKYEYLPIDGIGIKTTLRDISLVHSKEFNPVWLKNFLKVFQKNGVAVLAFFTASLFARQIKEQHQSFTFLEFTGEPGAGKSTLIRFVWRLLGRDNTEGIDLQSTSESSYGRHLSKVSNMPMVLLESDREKGKDSSGRPGKSIDWDIFKKIYDLDGVIDSRGVKTNDNTTNDRVFRGTLVISQNATVKASEAMLSRIVHLHADTSHIKSETRPLADNLKRMDVEELAGYLHQVLTHEPVFLERFFAAFENHRDHLTNNETITHDRVVDCHAQVMAAVDALQVVLPGLSDDLVKKVHAHIEVRAEDRQRRLSADHPVVEQFWDNYHFINDQVMHIDNEEGKRDVEFQRLNHSKDDGLIAVNLNEYIEHCRKRGQEVAPISLLKELLPTSQRYPFIKAKPVRSKKDKTFTRCWVFSLGVTS